MDRGRDNRATAFLDFIYLPTYVSKILKSHRKHSMKDFTGPCKLLSQSIREPILLSFCLSTKQWSIYVGCHWLENSPTENCETLLGSQRQQQYPVIFDSEKAVGERRIFFRRNFMGCKTNAKDSECNRNVLVRVNSE